MRRLKMPSVLSKQDTFVVDRLFAGNATIRVLIGQTLNSSRQINRFVFILGRSKPFGL